MLHFRTKVSGKKKAKVVLRKISGKVDLYVSFDKHNVIGGGKSKNACVRSSGNGKANCKGLTVGGAEYVYVTVHGVESFSGAQLKILAS